MEKSIEEKVCEHLLNELTFNRKNLVKNKKAKLSGDALTKSILDSIAQELGTNDRDAIQRVVNVLINTGVLRN